MTTPLLRDAWVEIDTQALRHNIRNIRATVGKDRTIYGVIKADAYGHGAVGVARILREEGIHHFAVATLAEAAELRAAGVEDDILMLGLTPDGYVDTLIEQRITPVINSYDNAKALSDAAAAYGTHVEGFVAIDTGMGRIGYLALGEERGGADAAGAAGAWATATDSAVLEIQKIAALPAFHIRGLFSHFATADAADKTFAEKQAERFCDFAARLEAAGVPLAVRTLANSAAIMEMPSVYFDAVRPGIILYGCYPSAEVDPSALDLTPVMSVKANIVKLKEVPVGFSCGYGQTFIATRPSKIATIPVGYADGFPRPYSPVGEVLAGGVRAPLAGNICMDQCMVDVTEVPGVKEGDEVVLLGSDGGQTILADDIAAATGTINYEILCAFGQRLPRVYR